MSQILRNQQTGQVGMKDAMHRTIPGSTRNIDMGQAMRDPLTGASITDSFRRQEMLNPSPQLQEIIGRMAPPMPAMAPRGGGGGGGGGRMGPQNQRKIMNLGPRTTAEWNAENRGPGGSTLNAAYGRGDFTRVPPGMGQTPEAPAPAPAPAPGQVTPADGGSLPPEPGMVWQDGPGWVKPPTPMAKGGTMRPGKNVYLVGEGGQELLFMRENGSGFVLPADVTAQVLPAMRDVTPKAKGGKIGYTPRAEGGEIMLERQGDLGTMRGFLTPSGSGFAEVQNEVGAEPIMPIDKFFADPSSNYQLDPTRPGMPLMPDAVSGPWAEPAMPVTPEMRQDLRSNTLGNFMALAAMPDTQRVVDPRQAMRERGIEAMANLDNIRYEQEQARVQRDLAARAARAPLGTPTAPAAPAMDRNMERFMRTPEGMRLAMEQQGRLAELEQRSQLASRAIPVRDEQGNIRGYTTGTGASLPNPETSRPRIGKMGDQWVQLNDDGTTTPFNAGTEPKFAWNGSQFIQLPPDIDETNLPPELKLVPRKGAEVGGAKTDTTKPGAAKPAATTPEGKSRVKALMDRRKQAAGTGGVSG